MTLNSSHFEALATHLDFSFPAEITRLSGYALTYAGGHRAPIEIYRKEISRSARGSVCLRESCDLGKEERWLRSAPHL